MGMPALASAPFPIAEPIPVTELFPVPAPVSYPAD